MSIGVALLGAGIFARDEHLPAIQKSSSLTLKAIYSNSEKSASALASTANVDAYYSVGNDSSRSLDALLLRSDIQAVVIALPILVQPEIIKKSLEAGKHVLSEKPIAKDVATAEELISWYEAGPAKKGLIWAVAENFRFLDVTQYGFDQVKKIGGRVTTFSMKLYGFIDESDKFYQTSWRQVPEYQGGFLLDGGVHFVAGLRYLLQAGGEKITNLAAFTTLLQKKLPPVDTVHGVFRASNGSNGTFNVSFGAEFKSGFEIELVTDSGAVIVKPTEVVVTTKNDKGEKADETEKFEFSSGVVKEVAAWGESLGKGKLDERQTPREALADLTILQKLLESGEQDGAPQKITL